MNNYASGALGPIDFGKFFQSHHIPGMYDRFFSVPIYYDPVEEEYHWPSSITAVTHIADMPGNDAFSRLRVSNPGYRFDSQFTYRINSDLWDTQVSTGSTILQDATNRWVTLTTATGSNAYARLQSHYHSPYTPGRSQLCYITGMFGAALPSGAVRKMGYRCIDELNGIYLEQTSTGVNFVLDGGTTLGTQRVSQSVWNVDTFDGQGNSGITLDLTKIQILVIDLQALYSGRVRCGFDVDGVLYWAHQFLHANRVPYPYIQLAGLPVSWEVTSSSGSVNMHSICATVISDGGADLFDIPGVTYGITSGAASIGVNSRAPILSIRVKSTYNNIMYNGLLLPVEIETMCQTNSAVVEIVKNGILSGPVSWQDVDTVRSATQYDKGATGIVSGSVVATTFAVAGTGSNRLTNVQNLLGKLVMSLGHLTNVQDTLTVVVTPVTGTSNVNCSIDWKEVR